MVVACSTVPVTGRQQVNLLSPGEEAQLGLTSFSQMKKDQKISADAATTAMLLRVGKRIAAVAGPDMPNAQWEFVLFDNKEANAFCLPGGKVGVYTGILSITQTEEGGMTQPAVGGPLGERHLPDQARFDPGGCADARHPDYCWLVDDIFR